MNKQDQVLTITIDMDVVGVYRVLTDFIYNDVINDFNKSKQPDYASVYLFIDWLIIQGYIEELGDFQSWYFPSSNELI